MTGLEVSGLMKRFGDVQALDGLSLAAPVGQLVGFLGPNGAGKSTTMRSILGLLAVDGGSITWNGEPITAAARRNIGYMPQDRGLYQRMKVGEHIAYIGRLAGLSPSEATARAARWAARVGLEDRHDDLIQDLSTGNQQRVQLAVAMVHDPPLLILDEPFAGLDPVAVAMLSDVMTEQVEQGATVVFSSHQLDLVEDLAENLTIVANGATRATGSSAELRRRSPIRLLRVEWVGEPPAWEPPQSSRLDSRPDVSLFSVPAASDSSALMASAAAAGSFVSISYEPPPLEDVFLGIVAS